MTGMKALAEQLMAGDRRALARSITLVESTRPDHRDQAAELLDAVLPATGRAVRLGITGTPGAGKSTFVEQLGTRLTRHVETAGGTDTGETDGHRGGTGATRPRHRVAVLAIDPSSRRSGGSILGDKTRMEQLARNPDAFIRPSPSAGTLGGVARRTREAGLLCEAAGFDVIVIETVGVGQSEIAVADMVDCFLLLAAPGGGDELQGIKRGIMELADLIVVNKADGDLLPAAQRAVADYRHAVHLLRPKHVGWTVPVLAVSAQEGTGVDEAWAAIEGFEAQLRHDGRLDRLRSEQSVAWMMQEIREQLVEAFHNDRRVTKIWDEVETAVRAGQRSPTTGARHLLAAHGAVDPGADRADTPADTIDEEPP